ncbi:hypothetical protein ABPG75_010387 [Micractinium tetrahymenae]
MSEDEKQEAPLAQEQPKAPKLPNLSARKLEKLRQKDARRGVVYISRIPPHLKPQKLRQMLEQYAEIGRVYLAPEDPALRKKRKQHGGNSGKNFTEGWVEFEDKAKAKEVVAMLDGQQMGGKRRSAYYYDLWCMKYLPKFKWDHLTEEINYQKAVREQRLAAEISAAKRERDFYLSRVDKAKAVNAMLERKRKRSGSGGEGGDRAERSGQEAERGSGGEDQPVKQAKQQQGSEDGHQRQQAQQAQRGQQQQREQAGGAEGGVKVLRSYGQRRAKADPVTDAAAPTLSSGLLKLIAGRKGKAGSGGSSGGGEG